MHNVELHTLLGNVGKGLLSWLQTMQQTGTLRKGEASHDGQLFQHSLVRRVKIEVRPAVELYLNELLIQKCKFRGRFKVSILSLDKLSPKASCHLDESSMNHTLAPKHLCEFWCGMHLTCKNTPVKPDRRNWMTGSEKLCEANLSTSLLDESTRSDAAHFN